MKLTEYSSLGRAHGRNLFCCLCFLLSSLAPLCLFAENSAPAIAISEVLFKPLSTNQPAAVELFNYGQENINLSGYRLVDKDRNSFTVPSNIVVQPGDVLLVLFGMRDELAAPIEFADVEANVIWCSDPWGVNAFRGGTNECSLFGTDVGKESSLIDYVAWGRLSRACPVSSSALLASSSGVWGIPGARVYVGNEPKPGDPAPVRAGGTIARVSFKKHRYNYRDWFVVSSSQTSLGQPNACPAPELLSPWQGASIELEGKLRFAWTGMKQPQSVCRVQVAKDADFLNIVIDELCNSSHFDAVIDAGGYYWRARWEMKTDTERGTWASPVEFVIK